VLRRRRRRHRSAARQGREDAINGFAGPPLFEGGAATSGYGVAGSEAKLTHLDRSSDSRSGCSTRPRAFARAGVTPEASTV